MRVAVITGASSGIGEATAHRLAREPGMELVLVARREEKLRALAGAVGCPATYVTADLVSDDAPARVRAHLEEQHGGALHILVNNAGAAWRGTFAEKGWENVRRTMELDFDAQVRLTEALLPLLRASAPSAIVNVSSTAGRIARPGTGAYSAAKFALTGWSDALRGEEAAAGVHVGVVLPGFIATEGFPAEELRAKPYTRWMVSTPDKAADAIADCALNGRAERYVPRPYAVLAVLRILAPGLMRRAVQSKSAAVLTTRTGADAAER